jgi:hypothetical protein
MGAPRPIHDVAFAIASALTEKMKYKLVDAKRQSFHRVVRETAKTALTLYAGPNRREGAGARRSTTLNWTESRSCGEYRFDN